MLELKNVSKTFNLNSTFEKHALLNVSLKVKKSDFITIIGGNGAGKSTILNVVAGNYFVDSGSILIDNKDITKMKEYKRADFISRLFQDPMKVTAPSLTIYENLSLALLRGKKKNLNMGIKKKNIDFFREKLSELNLGLEDRLKTKVGLLSGGQRQALTLVMATLTKPKILLLDEHTAALDPDTSKKVLTLTNKIIKDNEITALMITHDMQAAIEYGNRIIMMDNGKIILDADDKSELSVNKLLELFTLKSGKRIIDDSLLLNKNIK